MQNEIGMPSSPSENSPIIHKADLKIRLDLIDDNTSSKASVMGARMFGNLAAAALPITRNKINHQQE